MTNSQLMSEMIHSNPVTQPHPQPSQNPHQQSWDCRWAKEGFPKGPALLSYLYSELQESDSRAALLVRFLFLAAFQPYMQHMRSWMYSTASVAPHFGTAESDSAGVGAQALNTDVSGCTLTMSFSITNNQKHRSYRQTSWKQHPRLCFKLSHRTTTQEVAYFWACCYEHLLLAGFYALPVSSRLSQNMSHALSTPCRGCCHRPCPTFWSPARSSLC